MLSFDVVAIKNSEMVSVGTKEAELNFLFVATASTDGTWDINFS